jgi:hypothetical protein
MMPVTENSARTFKTAWFSKAARKALINDRQLSCLLQDGYFTEICHDT